MNSQDELIGIITNDGSYSMVNKLYNEAFHCSDGALKESIEKFIRPSKLDRFSQEDELVVLDVCFGLGYNLGSLLKIINKDKKKLHWWGLEIDKRPIKTALAFDSFSMNWSEEILEIFHQLITNAQWRNKNSDGKILWGEARETWELLPKQTLYDLIFLDAFSPPKCPELWTEEFISKLATRLKPNGRILTYSRAAAVRRSIQRSGLKVMSLPTINITKNNWTSGTVGIKLSQNEKKFYSDSLYKNLSQQEEEHLLTKAAVPYRDPSGKSTKEEIISRRNQEQIQSKLKNTRAWKKRWEIT